MIIELLENRSQENIEKILLSLNIEEKNVERTKLLFSRAKNLCLLRCNSDIVGFINFKVVPEKKVVYCPVHTINYNDGINVQDIMAYIKQLFPQTEILYSVFLDFFEGDINRYFSEQQTPFDKFIGMSLSSPFSMNISDTDDIFISQERIGYDELAALHQKAYRHEVVYAGEEWEKLLESFLTYPNSCIVTCRKSGELIGCCLGYQKESHHGLYSLCLLEEFHGKGLGYKILGTYLSLTNANPYHLGVFCSNTKAKKLYEKVGFIEYTTEFIVYKF
jgi:ribosomal protein S18 acetylase RimI-like enzyme